MPYSGIPDIHNRMGGSAVQRRAECRAHSGYLALGAGRHANDGALLDGIPKEKIVSIQINDVHDRPYAASVLRDESMHDRLAPGTGFGRLRQDFYA